MADIHFMDEEVAEIEAGLESGMEKVGRERDKELDDLHREHSEVIADYRYLETNGTRLLRQGVHTIESLAQEKTRLDTQRKAVEKKIKNFGERIEVMVEFVITFSELIKDASGLFKIASPEEQQRLTAMIFSELVFENGKLVKYTLEPEFKILMECDVSNGGACWTKS